MIVNSKYKVLRNPSFRLCSTCLPYTDKYKYLGHVICADLTDDADVMKLTRSLYARANSIIRKFSGASLTSKIVLFKAYCTPMYGCQLWSSVFQYYLNKLKVAYNDGFRLLLNEPRWCSASTLFVYITTFPHLTLFFANWFMLYGKVVTRVLIPWFINCLRQTFICSLNCSMAGGNCCTNFVCCFFIFFTF